MAKLEVYTVEECAEILKVTKRTIYKYVKDGSLRASKVGRDWRITDAAIQAFLENLEQKAQGN